MVFGFVCPVAVTAAGAGVQSVRGRAHDLLWMAADRLRFAQATDTRRRRQRGAVYGGDGGRALEVAAVPDGDEPGGTGRRRVRHDYEAGG